MNATVSVNGKISSAADAVVPVFNHGFLYGEGVYETLRTYQRVPFLYERHAERLRKSASMMELPVPFSDAEMLRAMNDTVEVHAAGTPDGIEEAYIRVLLTRGVGELTYNPAACPTPTTVIIVKPFPEPPARTFADGITLSLVSIRRNHPQALNPMIKSNNLINNALAMQEALKTGAEEALMCNQAGDIVECSQSNFFIVRDGAVLTPPLAAGLLPGITRAFVLELAHELGLPAREERLTPEDLATADEAFITGTTREVTPVARIDSNAVGTGKPGPITRRLLDHYRARVNELTSQLASKT